MKYLNKDTIMNFSELSNFPIESFNNYLKDLSIDESQDERDIFNSIKYLDKNIFNKLNDGWVLAGEGVDFTLNYQNSDNASSIVLCLNDTLYNRCLFNDWLFNKFDDVMRFTKIYTHVNNLTNEEFDFVFSVLLLPTKNIKEIISYYKSNQTKLAELLSLENYVQYGSGLNFINKTTVWSFDEYNNFNVKQMSCKNKVLIKCIEFLKTL